MKTRKLYIIEQLRNSGVRVSPDGSPLESMEYRALKYLLAAKRAVAQ